MNRRQVDTVVGGLVAAVFLVGGVLSWQAYQQRRAYDQMGPMMGTSMGSVHGTNPLWYVLGTVIVSAVIAGGYLLVRDELSTTGVPDRSQSVMSDSSADTESPAKETQNEEETQHEEEIQRDETITLESQSQSRVLDLLPEDERRILEPILSSPGITQIELRDRSNFSKSKVSQTVSALEKRGLLYRERQGRTYRIYPSDDLQLTQSN